MHTRVLDRLVPVVNNVLDELVPEHERLQWEISPVTEIFYLKDDGQSARVEQLIAIWMSLQEPEEGLTLDARITIPMHEATDARIEEVIREVWAEYVVERMETQFTSED